MKILYINTYIPYPLNSGGNQAFFMMADHVRKEHELSILLYIHNAKEKKYVKELQKLWDNVTFYLYEPKEEEKNTDSSFRNMSKFDRLSCSVFDYFQHSMKRKLNRREHKYNIKLVSKNAKKGEHTTKLDFVRANSTLFMESDDLTPSFCDYVKGVAAKDFDIIQVEFYDYLPLVYLLPEKTKKVFVHHELRFVRNEIEYNLYLSPLPTDKLLLEKEKAEELGCLKDYDAIITLTDIDKNILIQNGIPSDKLFTSPAITQTVEYEHKAFIPAKELVFIGSGNHFPNADAMAWFCQEVLPLLQKSGMEIPKINITGDWKEPLATSLKKLCPNIHFAGLVRDLQAFLNGKISIVPLRIGSGMRMKILDSAFAAAPVITTSKGCEGLPMKNDENCLIADTAESFAQAIIRILSDVELQQRLATNAQNSKTNMLNEKDLFEKRLNVYKTLLK